jgi:hypothetical protein
MKIYRIHTLQEEMYYSGYTDDYEEIEKDITVKYVSSLEKVNEFLSDINKSNKLAQKCGMCPINKLTTRKYKNNPSLVNEYCDHCKPYFNGNMILCANILGCDYNEYQYEEIEVK